MIFLKIIGDRNVGESEMFLILNGVSAAIYEQMWLCLVSILAGVLLAVVYDLFRALRRVRCLNCQLAAKRDKTMAVGKSRQEERKECFVVGLEDVIYCCLYVVVTYSIFYHLCNGRLSGYVILGEILGAVFYYLLIRNWGRCLFTCVLWQICTIIVLIFRIITLPFRILCGKIIKFLKSLVKSVKMVIINN